VVSLGFMILGFERVFLILLKVGSMRENGEPSSMPFAVATGPATTHGISGLSVRFRCSKCR
jgi:hypothetical protein